jgi:hypothetical protein
MASLGWYLCAAIVLWAPTIGVFCADLIAERSFGLQPWPLDSFLAIPLFISLILCGAYAALGVGAGLRRAKGSWRKALVVFIGVCLGAVNLWAWVLANLWFFIDVMHRDSL